MITGDRESIGDEFGVYSIDDDSAKLKIAEDIRDFARAVTAGLHDLPDGVRPDSFSVDPAVLTWGTELRIERPDGPEDDRG